MKRRIPAFLLGSFVNSSRMRPPGGRCYVSQSPMDAYTVLTDLMANCQPGEKTTLCMPGALLHKLS